MKRFAVLALCALSLAFNACEKQPLSKLDGVLHTHSDDHGHGDAGHAPAAAHDAGHAAKPADAAHGDTHAPKPAGDTAHGEAPKFFPEKK